MALSWDSFDSVPPPIVPTTPKVLGPEDFYPLIDEISTTHGVDPRLVRSMVKTESNFNPQATSKAGAKGLLQLMDPTAKELGVVDSFNPRQNLDGGVRYIKKLMDMYGGDQEKALAAYNFGMGNVAQGLEYPQETRDYITKVMAGIAPVEGQVPKSRAPLTWNDFGEAPSQTGVGNLLEMAKTGAKMVGQSAVESTTPVVPTGKLPLGMPGSQNKLVQGVLDVAYGVPEAGAALVSGAASFPLGQAGGLAALPRDEKSLAKAFDIAEKVNETGMYQPVTNTGQLLLKPIETAFGTFLGTVDKVARATAPEGATEEDLETRSKAWQYIANTALLGAPMAVAGSRRAARAVRKGKVEVTPEVLESAKAKVLADPKIPDNVKAQAAATPLDKIAEQINKGQATARVDKTSGPQVKFEGNADVVKGLLIEAEMREGRAKTAMRKAAKIVAEHDGDISTADLKGIKGINPTGSTGKAIGRIIEERKLAEGAGEVPEFTPPEAQTPPIVESPIVPTGTRAEVPVRKSSVAPTESLPIQEVLDSLEPGITYQGSSKVGEFEVHQFFTSEGRNFSSLSLEPEEVRARYEKVKEGFEPKVEEIPKISSEEAQQLIDNYLDTLDAKYGSDVTSKILKYKVAKEMGEKAESPITPEELAIHDKLYADRDAIDIKDLNQFIDTIIDNTGLETKEAEEALKRLRMHRENIYGVYFTSEALRDFKTDVTGPIEKLYNYFEEANDTGFYTRTYAKFRIGGNADKPVLKGKVIDEDGRPEAWNSESLRKAEIVYNAISKSQGLPTINLTHVIEKEVQKPKAIENVIETVIEPITKSVPEIITPEFDSISIAKEEGYEFPGKKRYSSFEDAQSDATSRGDNFEVVKIGEKFRVGKYTEEAPRGEYVPEVVETGEARRVFELAKEEEARKAAEGTSEVDELYSDGVTAEDWKVLEEITQGVNLDEIRLGEEVVAEVRAVKESLPPEVPKGRTVDSASAAQKFLEWRDSYVTKRNVATHVSVHEFTEFDSNFNKTGEGRNAFGKGHYFTSSKNVKKHYQNSLPNIDIKRQFLEELAEDASFEEAMELIETKNNPKQITFMKELEKNDWLGFDYPAQAISAAFKDLEGFEVTKELKDAIENYTNVYTVKLKPKENEYILWDKPMAEQYPKIKAVMEEESFSNTSIGKDFYRMLKRKLGNVDAVNEFLLGKGIKGNKYLDGISRKAGEGDYNYVIFSDKDIEILNRNGKSVKPPTPITKEALSLVDDKFAIFDKLEDAEAFRDAKGTDREIIRDPATGKCFLEPELDLLDKADMWEMGEKEYLENTYTRSGGIEDEILYYGERGTRRDIWDVINTYKSSKTAQDYSKFKNVRELVNSIAETSIDPDRRIIAKKISESVEGVELKLVGDRKVLSYPESAYTHDGIYDMSTNTVYIKDSRYKVASEEAALHESLHAATARRVEQGLNDLESGKVTFLTRPTKRLIELMNSVEDSFLQNFPKSPDGLPHVRKVLDYINSDPMEFISYGLSDKKFVEYMKSVKVDRGNLWGKFVDTIRQLLGIPKKASNAFAELIDITQDITSRPVNKKALKERIEEYYNDGVITREEFDRNIAAINNDKALGTTKDFLSIFKNDRGSVDVTPLRVAVDQIENVVKMAKKVGKTVDDYLSGMGVDQASIELFKASLANVGQMKQEIRDGDKLGTKILNPEGPIVHQTIKKDRNGKVVWTKPAVRKDLAEGVVGMDRRSNFGQDITRTDPKTGRVTVEHTTNVVDRFMTATETKINAFRGPIRDLYRTWRDSLAASKAEKAEVKVWLDGLKSQIAPERLKDFAIACYADMKSVKEAYEKMGITDIPSLLPHEELVKEQLLDYTRKFRERSNYIRTHTGQKAIPKLLDMKGRENYLPLFRDLNVLRELGLGEGMVNSTSAKLGQLSKTFNGMFNPHSKKRNVSDIPIELDPFKAIEKYSNYGLDEIHISPVAALAKELAYVKLPHPSGIGKVTLREWNPALSVMLSKWSDAIVGKDPTATAMANTNPLIHKGLESLSKNLVLATIGGSLRTIFVQPSSYVIAVPTLLDTKSTLYGLGRMVADRTFSRKASLAKQKSSVLAIREFDLAYSEWTDYVQRGLATGTKDWLGNKSMAPMKWVDGVVAEASWNAGYHYGKNTLKLGGDDLAHFADDVVEKTQGMGIKGAVSDIQTGKVTKWLTLLQTFGIADFNFIIRDVLGIKNADVNNKQALMRATKYIVATVLAGQLYKMMGYENVVPDPAGEYLKVKGDDGSDVHAVASAAGELLEKLPMIGGSAKYGSSLGGVMGEWASLVPEAAMKFSESLDWDKLTPREKRKNIQLIAKAIGYSYGVPMTNQIMKSINTAYNGGNPYEVIMGVYKEAPRGNGRRKGLPSSF